MNRAFILIAIIVVLLIVLKKIKPKAKNKKMSSGEFQQFYNELINYIHRMEGGISDDVKDTASKFPLKGEFIVNGKKYVNPHTNKGVTYKNFIEFSKSLGYQATKENFLDMPNNIWFAIFQKKYADKTKNLTDNPVLNYYIALWYWGGWYKGHVPLSAVADILSNKKMSNKEKLKSLVELRKIYFDKVISANPNNKKFEKGWKNRANEYYNLFSKYL